MENFKRTGYTFFKSYYDALECMCDQDYVKFSKAIHRYMLFDEEPDLPGMLKAVWLAILPNMLKSKQKSDNGRKGFGVSKYKANESKVKAGESKRKQSESNIEYRIENIEDRIKNKNNNTVGVGIGGAGGNPPTAVTDDDVRICCERLNEIANKKITKEEFKGILDYVHLRNSGIDPKVFVTKRTVHKTVCAWIDIYRREKKDRDLADVKNKNLMMEE